MFLSGWAFICVCILTHVLLGRAFPSSLYICSLSLLSRFSLLPVLKHCHVLYCIVTWCVLHLFSFRFSDSFSPSLFLVSGPPIPPSCSLPPREFSKEREKAKARGDFQKLREKQQLEEDLKVGCSLCGCFTLGKSRYNYSPLRFMKKAIDISDECQREVQNTSSLRQFAWKAEQRDWSYSMFYNRGTQSYKYSILNCSFTYC